MITRREVPAYTVYQRRKAVSEYTDEELTKKVKGCIVDCADCTWVHQCRYGQEFVARGLKIVRKRKKPKTDRRRRAV